MPGILELRRRFQGGGADLGAGATGMGSGQSAPGPGDTGGEGGYGIDTNQVNFGDGVERITGLEVARQNKIARNQKIKNFATNFLKRALVPFPIQVLMAARENLPQLANMFNQYYGTSIPTSLQFTGAPETKRIPGEGADQIQQTFQPGIINLTLPQQEDDFDEVAYEEQLRRNIGLL